MSSKFKFLITSVAVIGLNASVVYASTVSYTIKSGDSLYSIASQYHTTVQEIKAVNHLDSSLIYPGHVLMIPTPDASSPISPSNASYAIVQPGQSLWSISQAHNISLSQIEAWNHLSGSSILHVGQKLVVSGGSDGGSIIASSRSGSPDPSMAVSVRNLEVVQFSEKFLGVPYVWGGTSPAGFDCSGFTQYVYAHFGVYLGRTSYDQINDGTPVSIDNLAPGDLLFFSTDGPGASHVGLYVGNGEFINAAGNSVRYDSLSNSYWSSHYIGARQIS